MSTDFEVKTGWVVETTEDFCVRVADGTHDSPQRADIGKPLVTSKNIIGGRLDLSNTYNISVNDFIAINKRSAVHKNDVLLSMIGTVGEACLIEEEPDFAIKNVGLLKNDDEYKAKWLYFYLRSPKVQQLIKERLRGTTQQYLPLGEIRKFPVLYPQARHELELIVDNLWALHSKIELNRQINQTLESMAQTIFKSWFVDFEPVKAKIAALESGEDAEGVTRAAMRAISGKSDDELDKMEGGQPENYAKLKTTAGLFPAAMQETELGEVPEGWKVIDLKELSKTISKGTTPSKKQLADAEGIPSINFIKVKNVSDDGQITRAGLQLIHESIHQGALKRSMLEENDLLFSIAGTIGRVSIVENDLHNSNTNQAVAFIRLNGQEHLYLVLEHLKSKRIQESAMASVVQGVQANVSLTSVGSFQIVVPNEPILAAWNEVVLPHHTEKLGRQKQNRLLSQLRDTLLPKLLSGDLSIDAIKITRE